MFEQCIRREKVPTQPHPIAARRTIRIREHFRLEFISRCVVVKHADFRLSINILCPIVYLVRNILLVKLSRVPRLYRVSSLSVVPGCYCVCPVYPLCLAAIVCAQSIRWAWLLLCVPTAQSIPAQCPTERCSTL